MQYEHIHTILIKQFCIGLGVGQCERTFKGPMDDFLFYQLKLLLIEIMRFCPAAAVKGCLHGTIASYFLQLMGCIGFSVDVAIAQCEHLR